MSSEVELLPVNENCLIFIGLVTPAITVFDDKAVPIGEELVLSGVSPKHVIVVIGVFPAIRGSQVGLGPVETAGKDWGISEATAPAATLKVHYGLFRISVQAITRGEVDSCSWTVDATGIGRSAVVQVQLEWSHLVNTSIVYSGRNDKVIADAAQILTIDDLGIAGLTPSDSPRVLSNPVVNRPSGSCIGAPPNN